MWKIVKMPIADWLSNPPPLYINIGFGLRLTFLKWVLPAGSVFDRGRDPYGWKGNSRFSITPYQVHQYDIGNIWPLEGSVGVFICILCRYSRSLTPAQLNDQLTANSYITAPKFGYGMLWVRSSFLKKLDRFGSPWVPASPFKHFDQYGGSWIPAWISNSKNNSYWRWF